MVEKIEGLSTELKIDAFAETRVFHQRDVDVLIPRAIEDIAPGIAELSVRRNGKRRREVRGEHRPQHSGAGSRCNRMASLRWKPNG